MLAELDRLPDGRESDVAKPLERLAAALLRRGIIVLISDLLDDPAKVIKGLELLRARGSDVVVFQILDRAELTFPFQDATQFQDLETGREVLTRPADVRDDYLASMNAMFARYTEAFGAAGIEYLRIDTHEPLDAALSAWLAARARRR